MRRPAPFVATLATLLAASGPSALAQDSEKGVQPRAPWPAAGAESEAAEATGLEVGSESALFPRVAPDPPSPPVQEAPAQDAQDQPPPPEDERRTTLFKSLGMALEDLVAADLAYRKAVEKGIGREVKL